MEKIYWHHKKNQEVFDFFKTDKIKGLTDKQVLKNRLKFGANEIKMSKKRSALLRFFDQINQPLIYVLLVSATIALYFKEYVDSFVIYAVVLANAVMGFIQENKAFKSLESLFKTMTVQAHVIRNGVLETIPAQELVPGDLVVLHSGEKIPADLRLFEVHDFRVDESALTGESVPIIKSIEKLALLTVLSDRKNMAFSSTFATFWQARAIVVNTGNATEIGKISNLISQTRDLKTPLTEKIEIFSKKLLWLIVAFSVLAFIVGRFLRGLPFVSTFMSAIAMAVAAIPEGLPATVTIILAVGVNRMSKRKSIVRKLPAVETLGSTSVICSDKTGTLTENKMTVQHIFAVGKIYVVDGVGYQIKGDFTPFEENKALEMCLKIGVLCNDADLKITSKQTIVDGDPTEIALLVSAAKRGFDIQGLRNYFWKKDEIPFESAYQYMANLRSDDVIYLKGATETILPFCTMQINEKGEIEKLDEAAVLSLMEQMASQGLRVLGFAFKPNFKGDKITHKDVQSGLIFAGLQGMIDPPRRDAVRALAVCHHAGICVKMITGDHLVTAKAIA